MQNVFIVGSKGIPGADGGYEINGVVKESYMTNVEWEAFKAGMSEEVIVEYSAGGGDDMISFLNMLL